MEMDKMISTEKKIIFIHIPKTGGSSIEVALKNIFDEKIIRNGNSTRVLDTIKNPIPNSYNSFKHATASELIKQYGKNKFNDYHSFAVIRNPWDRLLSLYHWSYGGTYNKKKFLNMIPKKINNMKSKRVVWSLNRYVCDNKDNIIIDTLLDFDNLQHEFSSLMKKLNIGEYELGHINKGRNKKNFREVMDQETIDLISTNYKNEINMFWGEYEF